VEDGGIEDCDGTTTQDTSSPFVDVEKIGWYDPCRRIDIHTIPSLGMFTLVQSNFSVETLIIDSVMFTIIVLCRGTNGRSMWFIPLWFVPMFVTTKGYVEVEGVVPLYVHSIVTSEQVTRFGTVKKAICPVWVVVIWTQVRQEAEKEKQKLPRTSKRNNTTGPEESPT